MSELFVGQILTIEIHACKPKAKLLSVAIAGNSKIEC